MFSWLFGKKKASTTDETQDIKEKENNKRKPKKRERREADTDTVSTESDDSDYDDTPNRKERKRAGHKRRHYKSKRGRWRSNSQQQFDSNCAGGLTQEHPRYYEDSKGCTHCSCKCHDSTVNYYDRSQTWQGRGGYYSHRPRGRGPRGYGQRGQRYY